MAVLSGKDSWVQDGAAAVTKVGEWSVDPSADIVAKRASNTGGGAIQVPGNTDWSGNYRAFGPIPALQPGAAFDFRGSFEPTTNKGAEGTAIVDGVEIRWKQAEGGLIDHTVNFSANGALSTGAITAPLPDGDVSTPAHFTSIGCLVKTDTPGASFGNELANVQSVTLTMTRDNKPYNASTGGAVTLRKQGNFTAELSIDVFISDPTEIHAFLNALKQIQIDVDGGTGTDAWQLESMMLNSITGIGASIENADLIAATLNFMYSSHYASGATAGYITDATPTTPVAWFGTAP